MRADAGEIDKSVNRAQEMILRHERIEIELVKERALRHLPRSHHRQILPDPANWISDHAALQLSFFNGIGSERTDASQH